MRELKNVVHRAFILADPADARSVRSAWRPSSRASVRRTSRRCPWAPLSTLAEAERRLILATLDHFAGDKRKASKALGVSLRTLYNRLIEYGAAPESR